ncbi:MULTISPECIES: extracellular solute-binding protein [Mycetocola]|uniref:extracellular solute-binding protein n=1 Tax=Mycetocola TaxID=76634 RepID=UPI000AF9362C|nr:MULTISPECIES: extracellular solute-binding protein [Mycetocola]
MYRRKLAVTAALVTTTALLLTGCGRSDGPATGDAAAGPKAGDGKASGTVVMWAQGASGEALPELVKGFEKENPDVKVQVTGIPWSSAHQKYQSAIAAGTVPDVAQMGTTYMADFADAFENPAEDIKTDGIFEAARNAAVVGGRAAGVPWYVDTRVIFYRTDLAAQAGITQAPKTWADFTALARAYQEQAGAEWGVRLPTGGTDSFQAFLPFAWSSGAELMNKDQTEWTLDTPEMVSALTEYQKVFTDKVANPNASTEAGAAESNFVSGNTPMLIGPPQEIGLLNKAGGEGFDAKYAVARIPEVKSSTSFAGGSSVVVFKKAKNPEAARLLVKWLTEKSTQTEFYKLTGNLPAVEDAWNDASLTADTKLSVFRDQLGDAKSPPTNTAWVQVSAGADTVFERVVKGAMTPAEAAKELQSQAAGIGIGK